ncbi:unnamed protein product [Cuscuta europaea]|uniref:Ty3 transposon capsid-like protein domain-containing protein n=1 Tax=Cuscuta europaea TaxID=41803 RepID=A0A9P1A0L1_CUSEU|nr:unnamed protein product [Cuscuta europaea]
MRFTRAKMEGRINELEERTERNMQEMQNTLVERMAAMQAAMQADIAKLQIDRTRSSRSRSHRSSTSHRSNRHRRSRNDESSESNDSHSDHSVSRHNHHRRQRNHHQAGRKIDLPIFNGKDACGWLLRMNHYFRLNRTEEVDKIDVAVIAMEDQALSWFQWWEGQALQQNWNTFTQALTKQFQPDLVQDPLGPLFNLKQKGTIQEYRDKFETAIASQGHLTEEVLRGVFLKGLKRDIRAELKLHRTRTLAEVMDTASAIENKNSETLFVKNKEEGKRKGQNKPIIQFSGQKWGDESRWKSHPYTSASMDNFSVDHKSNEDNKGWNFRKEGPSCVSKNTSPRLSQEELMDRSKKGLF